MMRLQEKLEGLWSKLATAGRSAFTRGSVRPFLAACVLLVLMAVVFALGRWSAAGSRAAQEECRLQVVSAAPDASGGETRVYAHNLELRKGDHFRIFVRWLSGMMVPTRKDITPSFDAPQSFVLQVHKGVISVELKDLADFLNDGMGTGSPLGNIDLTSDGEQLALSGTLHKLVPLPVKVTGTMSPLPDGRVDFHVTGISVLKVPVKGLLGAFHVQLADLVASPAVAGVDIAGNDIRFDTEALLPPPHIHGQITTVMLSPAELRILYGHADDREDLLSQWHNFLRFEGGDLAFGKLTMHDVDLTMIDTVEEPWFDLDLVNYQAQLVNSYMRTTAKAGLEIYMPDPGKLPKQVDKKAITLQWLKNRNSALPGDVPFR